MLNCSNFFVFGTLRNVRYFLETAGETASDGGGVDVGFCNFSDFWDVSLFWGRIFADLLGGVFVKERMGLRFPLPLV